MRLALRTTVAAIAALALAAPAAAVISPAVRGAGRPEPQGRPKNPKATPFALRAWGYSTRVIGGDVPAELGPHGLRGHRLHQPGRPQADQQHRRPRAAEPGHRRRGVKTRVWTTRKAGTVSSCARNTIGKVVLSDSPLGTAHAGRRLDDGPRLPRRLRRSARPRTPTWPSSPSSRPSVRPKTLPLPTPGRPVEIPRRREGDHRPVLDAPPTPTARGPSPTASRSAWSPTGHALSGSRTPSPRSPRGVQSRPVQRLGRTRSPATPQAARQASVATPAEDALPGHRRRRPAPAQPASPTSAARSSSARAKSDEVAKQNNRRAWGCVRSRVASINLARPAPASTASSVRSTSPARARTCATLSRQHQGHDRRQDHRQRRGPGVPDTGVIEIPGVAKLEPSVVTKKVTDGLKVTALRITLLDGSGAVIDLGNARFQVRRSTR